jgi:hypothetical protein
MVTTVTTFFILVVSRFAKQQSFSYIWSPPSRAIVVERPPLRHTSSFSLAFLKRERLPHMLKCFSRLRAELPPLAQRRAQARRAGLVEPRALRTQASNMPTKFASVAKNALKRRSQSRPRRLSALWSKTSLFSP